MEMKESNIQIKTREGTVGVVQALIFPGGEVQVQVPTIPSGHGSYAINFIARIENSVDLMTLILAVDATKTLYGPDSIGTLKLGYIPYMQQDRVCGCGEALSARVFAQLINSLEFDLVHVIDPHSDVAPALLNNVRITTQADVIDQVVMYTHGAFHDMVLVSPDAGANKKMADICKVLGHADFIRADKVRNCRTGDITGTTIFCDDLKGQDVLIVDDICIGGRTFTALAKALKVKNAGKISLYVTHGIFSNGVKHLIDNGIDTIYTTNTRSLHADNVKFIGKQLFITNVT